MSRTVDAFSLSKKPFMVSLSGSFGIFIKELTLFTSGLAGFAIGLSKKRPFVFVPAYSDIRSSVKSFSLS